jgi:hypothetical protein
MFRCLFVVLFGQILALGVSANPASSLKQVKLAINYDRAFVAATNSSEKDQTYRSYLGMSPDVDAALSKMGIDTLNCDAEVTVQGANLDGNYHGMDTHYISLLKIWSLSNCVTAKK